MNKMVAHTHEVQRSMVLKFDDFHEHPSASHTLKVTNLNKIKTIRNHTATMYQRSMIQKE